MKQVFVNEIGESELQSLTSAKRNTSNNTNNFNSVCVNLKNASEGTLKYPKNYTRQGNSYTYGKTYNCFGYRYQPLKCFYGNDRIDIIYDIRTWFHHKELLPKMLAEGHVLFEDFHAQVHRWFNNPNHLLQLFRKFHEDENFYNELMWLREDEQKEDYNE